MSFDIKKEFVDKKKSVEGVWIDFTDGSRVKIARTSNPEYLQLLAKGLKDLRVKNRNRGISKEASVEVTKYATAHAILLGWENFVIDGEDVPFSHEKALEFFNKAPDFYLDIIELSIENDYFREELVGEAEKNSSTS